MNAPMPTRPTDPEEEQFCRVAGLYRSWDVSDVIRTGGRFLLESTGETTEGETLFHIYQHTPDSGTAPQESER